MVKNPPATVEDMVSVPGSGRSPVDGNDNPLSILAWEILWTEEPGKNTGVGCHVLLQGIFPTQGLNQRLPQWQEDSLPLSHLGSTASVSTGKAHTIAAQ